MDKLDAASILSYGVIGLGFLLAVLAYRLLVNEQKKPQPNRSILVAIHVFMIFSAVLCVIGGASEYFKARPDPDTTAEVSRLNTQMGKLTQERDDLAAKVKTDREENQQLEGKSKEEAARKRSLADSMEVLLNTKTMRIYEVGSDQSMRKHIENVRNGIQRLRGPS